jgi:hypothetical protein
MAHRKIVPRIRAGLIRVPHVKNGKAYTTIMDPVTLSVSLLDEWEAAVLASCDGNRSSDLIARAISPNEETRPDIVARVVEYLRVLSSMGLVTISETDISERDVDELEWLGDSSQDEGEFGIAPFITARGRVPVGVSPTLALRPDSAAEDRETAENLARVLPALSSAVSALSGELAEQIEGQPPSDPSPPRIEIVGISLIEDPPFPSEADEAPTVITEGTPRPRPHGRLPKAFR